MSTLAEKIAAARPAGDPFSAVIMAPLLNALFDVAEAALAVDARLPQDRVPFGDASRAMREALDRLAAVLPEPQP